MKLKEISKDIYEGIDYSYRFYALPHCGRYGFVGRVAPTLTTRGTVLHESRLSSFKLSIMAGSLSYSKSAPVLLYVQIQAFCRIVYGLPFQTPLKIQLSFLNHSQPVYKLFMFFLSQHYLSIRVIFRQVAVGFVPIVFIRCLVEHGLYQPFQVRTLLCCHNRKSPESIFFQGDNLFSVRYKK